jgi:hypothetical protein
MTLGEEILAGATSEAAIPRVTVRDAILAGGGQVAVSPSHAATFLPRNDRSLHPRSR